ncbi:MAG: hypothetical protein WAK95_17530 [Desulfobacterales bacterium]
MLEFLRGALAGDRHVFPGRQGLRVIPGAEDQGSGKERHATDARNGGSLQEMPRGVFSIMGIVIRLLDIGAFFTVRFIRKTHRRFQCRL